MPAPPDLVAHLRRQSAACQDIGSPMYSALMGRAADDLAAGGPVAGVLEGWSTDPGPGALALRLFGTVHRLALTGQAPALARFYPSVAGREVEPFDADRAWTAFRELLADRAEQIRAGLASPPQTNEIGRSAALLGGLLILRRRFDLPVRLVEIGASAGLNLRPDLVRIELPDWRTLGPAGSPVVLSEPWHGVLPPTDRPVEIVERFGSDVDPVDVATASGRLRLTSYVWADQWGRLARLRGAFDLAQALPVPVHAERAAATVAAVKPVEGTLTLIWHSVMWQYLPAEEQLEIDASFETLGALATPAGPVARLSLEPRRAVYPFPSGVEFQVRMRTWPGRGVELLATAHPHGDTVVWVRG